MNKKLLLGFAILFLVQSPGVLALDCEGISQENLHICEEILNSNLTIQEKEILISNLEYTSTYYPDHNYVFLRNNLIEADNPSFDIEEYQGTYIRNAWVSIFAAMPSIIYNNSLFVPERTQIFTGFHYDLAVPFNYQSSGYPEESGGDCRRDYTLVNNISENRVYVNGLYQGSGRLTEVLLNQNSNISAVYDINADVQINHHEWTRYCCRHRNGRCVRYCHRCDFSWQEIDNDRLVLSDSITVQLYQNNLTGSLGVINHYGETTILQPNFSNSIEILFNSSSYKFYQNYFEINYSKAPYYVATLKARDYNQERIFNILRDEENLVVQDTSQCRIRSFDFFEELNTNCDLSYEDFSFTIDTNKFYYSSGEDIEVIVNPSNITPIITYGNVSLMGNNVSFNATFGINKIEAFYDGKRVEKLIAVYKKSEVFLVWKIFLLILVAYLFYRIMKKKIRRIA